MKKNYPNINITLLKIVKVYSQDIDFDSNLYEYLYSLDFVELIMELEKEFGISIPDDHAEEMSVDGFTLKDIKRSQSD